MKRLGSMKVDSRVRPIIVVQGTGAQRGGVSSLHIRRAEVI